MCPKSHANNDYHHQTAARARTPTEGNRASSLHITSGDKTRVCVYVFWCMMFASMLSNLACLVRTVDVRE